MNSKECSVPHEEEGLTARKVATGGRRSFRRGLVMLVWLHLLLVLHFTPPSTLFSGEAIYAIDFSLHYYQADRALQTFESAGRLWGWDPLVLAGHPVGTLEDLSSKTLEIFVIALTRLGLDKALAFNLYVLMVHLLVPFVAWAVGRLFRLGDQETLILIAFWVLLWFFDSFFHWLWYCGMVSWALTSYLALLFVALFYRAIEALRRGEPAKRALLFGLPAVLTGAFLAMVHPFAVFPVGLPALWIYFRARKSVGLAGHLIFLATVLLSAIATSVWLLPAIDWLHYLIPLDAFLHPSPLYLLSDFLDLTFDHAQTGAPVRTVFRMLVLVLGAAGFLALRQVKDRRFGPLAFAFSSLFLLAYFGGLLPILKETQPYRQLAPAILFATLPAALALPGLLRRRTWSKTSRPLRVFAVAALILLAPRFARTVLYFLPETIPRHAHGPASFGRVEEPLPKPMKHSPPKKEVIAVRAFLVKALREKPGRVAVDNFALSEYLAATTDIPVLGGYLQRPVAHIDAHILRIRENGLLPPDELGAFLKRFAVRFVVVGEYVKGLELSRGKHLTHVWSSGDMRIYESIEEPSYFLRGSGKVVYQGINSIKVDLANADPEEGDLVLRFHWAETLDCRPDCRVEREPVIGARVGFIRIDDPPPQFEIYNSYQQLHPRWQGEPEPLPEF